MDEIDIKTSIIFRITNPLGVRHGAEQGTSCFKCHWVGFLFHQKMMAKSIEYSLALKKNSKRRMVSAPWSLGFTDRCESRQNELALSGERKCVRRALELTPTPVMKSVPIQCLPRV